MRIPSRTALIVALGVLAPAAAHAQSPPPPPAPAAPSTHPSPEVQSQAEAISARAFEAYGKGEFATALSLYQQALLLAPAAAIYFNVANIYDKKLPDPHLAIDFYRKCVSASDTTPELTIKATARVQALSQELAAKQPAAPRAEEAATGEDPGKGMKIAGGVILGLGAVGLGMGIGFGVDANAKLQTAQKTCNGPVCDQNGFNSMNAANSSATVSTAMFVVGGVFAATGIVLLAVAPSRRSTPATTGVRFTPVVAPGHAGFALSGAFF